MYLHANLGITCSGYHLIQYVHCMTLRVYDPKSSINSTYILSFSLHDTVVLLTCTTYYNHVAKISNYTGFECCKRCTVS